MASPYDLEHVINAIADPIFVKDRRHTWVLLNDAVCKLMGQERSSLIGKSDYDFFPKSEADVFWHKDEEVFESGQEVVNDEQFTDSSGTTHVITTKKTLYINPAGEKFIVGCIRDLTERSRMEQELQRAREELEDKVRERTLELGAINRALSIQIEDNDRTSAQLRQSQKMEAIGQLAGGIAHDFNNLLNIIIGYGSLVERRAANDPELKDVAHHIIDAAETAASLTRQLLAFSRKQVLQPEVLELNSLVSAAGSMLRRLIGEDIELEIKTAADAGCIRVDRGQFEQVIINLAVNARDAMLSGGKLTIETASAESPVKGSNSEYASLKVSDTGHGIEPEVQAHIFEPFFTTKEQGKGTGLGLATVYGIVAQSAGKVTVRSAAGAGTTFTVLLPKVASGSSRESRRSTRVDDLPKGSGTVLLVEDQPELRMLLRNVLRTQGYEVLEAESGADAITTAANRRKVDLLITDIVMPGMRGWELAHKLCAIQPNLKVIYISGHTDTDLIKEGALLSGGVFLEKPFRPELLLERVSEILHATDSPAA